MVTPVDTASDLSEESWPRRCPACARVVGLKVAAAAILKTLAARETVEGRDQGSPLTTQDCCGIRNLIVIAVVHFLRR